METIALNELVALRQRRCATKHILIDTELGLAKGYTKAKFFHAQKAPPQNEYEFISMSKRLFGQVNSLARISAPKEHKPGNTSTITPFTLQDNSHSSHSQAGLTSTQTKPKAKIPRPLPDILKELGVDYLGDN